MEGLNKMRKKTQNTELNEKKALHISDVRRSAYIYGKKKLPKGKYKNVYSYELPDGKIVNQSFLPKYKWSAYHDSEKKAAIAVDKFLIAKGKEPINVLVRK